MIWVVTLHLLKCHYKKGFPNDAKFRYLPNILRMLAHRPQKGHFFLKFQQSR